MTRPLRLEFAGAIYHLTSRGDRREDMHLDDGDRGAFFEVLAETCERFAWACHAYCLMTNHYHLVIETREATLSRGMRQLNGVYTQRFNRLHQRVGHLFQGRYKAIFVQKDAYLLELARYVVLNPVRAGMVRSARDWPWSSYRATAGDSEAPAWLSTDWLLSAFGSRRGSAQQAYRQFISAGRGQRSPWSDLKHQIYLGDERFVRRMQTQLADAASLDEIPATQRRALPKPLGEYERSHRRRDEAIAAAYRDGGHTMKAIGEHFGPHYSMISRIVRSVERGPKTKDLTPNCNHEFAHSVGLIDRYGPNGAYAGFIGNLMGSWNGSSLFENQISTVNANLSGGGCSFLKLVTSCVLRAQIGVRSSIVAPS